MTLDEAKKVAAICITADGGCSQCVRHLFEHLNESFPELVWTVIDSYSGKFSVEQR